MYGLASVTGAKDALVRKCNSHSGICCLRHRNTGLASTISPMDENRITSILGNKKVFINVQ